jgi:uncharacterized OB-fold protein
MSDRDAGYDEFLAGLAGDGPAEYLVCPAGHASLPPRGVCPECGDADLAPEPLPETGEVHTYTETHVATPAFADDAPYVTAIADFGPVELTGQVRGIAAGDLAVGTTVAATAEETADGESLVVFRPR